MDPSSTDAIAQESRHMNSTDGHAQSERFERGWRNLRAIAGEAGEGGITGVRESAPAPGGYIVAFAFGDIYARPDLDWRSRQVATVAALTALGTAAPELEVHVNAALNVGLTRDQIIEVIIHVAVFAGFPAAINAIGVARKVFAERDAAPSGIPTVARTDTARGAVHGQNTRFDISDSATQGDASVESREDPVRNCRA